ESAVQVPGGVLVSGYALDLNSTTPIAVHFYADNKFAGAVSTTVARPDLAARFPAAGHTIGYQITIPFAGGSHLLCAYALNVGPGANTLLRCVRVTLQDNPVGK